MKKNLAFLLMGAAIILLPAVPAFSTDDDGPAANRPPRPTRLETRLNGFNEVTSLSTPGTGSFRAMINAERTAISYVLTYDDTEDRVFMAHIHFGQEHTNGPISVWFCGGDGPVLPPPSVPAGLPLCPPGGTPLQGTITAADVIGPTGQGIAPGEFDELVRAILAGATYVNVHSEKYVPGEVRGQIESRRIGPN